MSSLYLTGKKAKAVLKTVLEKYDSDKSKYPISQSGYYKEEKAFVAFDNQSRDCWVEEFRKESRAIAWLNWEFHK